MCTSAWVTNGVHSFRNRVSLSYYERSNGELHHRALSTAVAQLVWNEDKRRMLVTNKQKRILTCSTVVVIATKTSPQVVQVNGCTTRCELLDAIKPPTTNISISIHLCKARRPLPPLSFFINRFESKKLEKHSD